MQTQNNVLGFRGRSLRRREWRGGRGRSSASFFELHLDFGAFLGRFGLRPMTKKKYQAGYVPSR